MGYILHFQGATIVSAIFDALKRGVTGLLKLTEATEVLISEDFGGGVGARAHLDRLAARLRASNVHLDDSCLAAHPTAAYLCADDS